MAADAPHQLVGLQDVLCLVVDEAISLAYFVFSHSGVLSSSAAVKKNAVHRKPTNSCCSIKFVLTNGCRRNTAVKLTCFILV